MYQRTWHGIELASLPSARMDGEKPVGVQFYEEFYEALSSGKGKVESSWVEAKRGLGRTYAAVFKKWDQNARILAVAAGRGYVEEEWLKEGFDVTFNDCQEHSLADLRKRHPDAKFLIADAREIKPGASYDIITLITLDYALSREELQNLLQSLSSQLADGGRIVLYCTSALNWRQLAVEFAKGVMGVTRRVPHVFWGWWRSPGELQKIGKKAGLRSVVFDHAATGLVQRPEWRSGWLSLKSVHCTVVYQSCES